MRSNVGGLDRALRWALGALFFALGVAAPVNSFWRVPLFALTVIALFTAITAYCPVNQLFGIDTSRRAHG
jgi:DUF2892 family protein